MASRAALSCCGGVWCWWLKGDVVEMSSAAQKQPRWCQKLWLKYSGEAP